ncbi:MAG: hypothetical protein KME43_00860 [Myxacorys chilensis ATA2-1-KO14]|jgi:hypothetical protein|nr:hypothetical protein [Myxacorys chilensis ATA2-1-KO14]
MFIIELTLKTNPIPLSVQRKSEEDAQETYQKIVDAIKSGGNQLLELACDRQPEKKLAIFTDSLAAVQMYEKSSATSSGRTPGFFSMAEA